MKALGGRDVPGAEIAIRLVVLGYAVPVALAYVALISTAVFLITLKIMRADADLPVVAAAVFAALATMAGLAFALADSFDRREHPWEHAQAAFAAESLLHGSLLMLVGTAITYAGSADTWDLPGRMPIAVLGAAALICSALVSLAGFFVLGGFLLYRLVTVFHEHDVPGDAQESAPAETQEARPDRDDRLPELHDGDHQGQAGQSNGR